MRNKVKYLILSIVLLAILVFIFSNKKIFQKQTKASVTLNSGKNISAPAVKIINILPLGYSVSDELINETALRIREFLPVVKVKERTKFPVSAFYKPRGRNRADSTIAWLNRLAKPNEIYLGLTSDDISTTLHDTQDWGVMGLGFSPGHACVASSFRLTNKKAFWKVAIHELGHTAGLNHCPTKTCFMRDAEGRNPTSEETEFCSNCKKHLKTAGWVIK